MKLKDIRNENDFSAYITFKYGGNKIPQKTLHEICLKIFKLHCAEFNMSRICVQTGEIEFINMNDIPTRALLDLTIQFLEDKFSEQQPQPTLH